MDWLSSLVKRESIDLVVPQTTPEVVLLSRRQHQLRVPVLVADSEAVERANNKAELAQHFARSNMLHPQFLITDDPASFKNALDSLGYPNRPVVVKMLNSSGGRGVRIVDERTINWRQFSEEKPDSLRISLRDIQAALYDAPSWPKLMLSEFLEGPEYSVDVYLGSSGQIAIPRQRQQIRSGITFEAKIRRHPELESLSLWAAKTLGLEGVSGFQYILANGDPHIIECNPRIQGTMVASCATGNNLIWAAARDSLGMPPRSELLDHGWTNATCERYWGIVLRNGHSETVI